MQFFIGETTEIFILISYAFLTIGVLALLAFDNKNQVLEKIFWLFFIIFVPYLGAILYFLRYITLKNK